MRTIWITLAALISTLLVPTSSIEAAQPVRVAVPTAIGPKAARPGTLTAGVVAGLREQGLEPVAGRRLRSIAKEAGMKSRDPRIATAAKADYVVLMRVKKSKRKKTPYVITVELLDGSGEMVKRYRTRHRRPKKARAKGASVAKKVARLVAADGLAAAGAGVVASGSTADQAATDSVATAPPTALRTQPPVGEEPPANEVDTRPVFGTTDDAATFAPSQEPPTTIVEVEPTAVDSSSGMEANMIRFRVSGGTQLLSAYDVTVNDTDTGLTYDLGAIPLVQGDVHFVFDFGLGARAEFGFSPVSYDINVAPPLNAAEPAGSFIGVGGHVFYEIDLAKFSSGGRFALVPLVGAGFNMLSVDSQGVNSVVLSYEALDLMGGLRFLLQLGRSFAVEADVRGGYLLGYSEEPTTTGADGTGFTIQAGGAIRYWFIDALGLTLDTTYRLVDVSLNGAGTRARFAEDPPLVDAAIATSDLKVSMGVVVGF